jgi:predicted Zn-dependent protease
MDPAERIASFRKLLASDPKDPMLHYGLATTLLGAGEPGEAATHLEAAIQLNPDYTAAYRELGRALEALGRTEEALEAWRRGIEVASKTGDLQAGKEMTIFSARLRAKPSRS